MASFYYFFNSKFILICFWQFFFVKSSNNFFSIKIINNICQRHNVFNFLNQKHFFWPIWNVTFCKNIFTFWYSNKITNFKFKIFIVNVFTRIKVALKNSIGNEISRECLTYLAPATLKHGLNHVHHKFFDSFQFWQLFSKKIFQS